MEKQLRALTISLPGRRTPDRRFLPNGRHAFPRELSASWVEEISRRAAEVFIDYQRGRDAFQSARRIISI